MDPIALFTVQFSLARVVDLNHPANQLALGVTRQQLTTPDWRGAYAHGHPIFTHAVGTRLNDLGIQGLIYPSAKNPTTANMATFIDNLEHPRVVTISDGKTVHRIPEVMETLGVD